MKDVEGAKLSAPGRQVDIGGTAVNNRQHDLSSENLSVVASTDATSSASHSSELRDGIGARDTWGWHDMRGRSAKHGNIPLFPSAVRLTLCILSLSSVMMAGYWGPLWSTPTQFTKFSVRCQLRFKVSHLCGRFVNNL